MIAWLDRLFEYVKSSLGCSLVGVWKLADVDTEGKSRDNPEYAVFTRELLVLERVGGDK